jgi:hypothetical protein
VFSKKPKSLLAERPKRTLKTRSRNLEERPRLLLLKDKPKRNNYDINVSLSLKSLYIMGLLE